MCNFNKEEIHRDDLEQSGTWATLARIRHFQKQIEKIQEVETNPQNYRLSVGGFLSEIDRINLEVREYFSIHPRIGRTSRRSHQIKTEKDVREHNENQFRTYTTLMKR